MLISLALTLTLTLSQTAPSLGQGRALIKQMYELKGSKLWAASGPGLKQQLGSRASLTGFITKLQRDFGNEVRVISEGLASQDGELTTYRRVAAFSNWARGVEIELTLGDDGKLMGVSARPASKEAPTTYGTHKIRTRLRLPFEGQYYVLWGGRSWQNNRHSAVPDQRYALDLLQLTRSGRTFEGNGSRNDQFVAWGKPVLAAGEGLVAVAEDVVLDNELTGGADHVGVPNVNAGEHAGREQHRGVLCQSGSELCTGGAGGGCRQAWARATVVMGHRDPRTQARSVTLPMSRKFLKTGQAQGQVIGLRVCSSCSFRSAKDRSSSERRVERVRGQVCSILRKGTGRLLRRRGSGLHPLRTSSMSRGQGGSHHECCVRVKGGYASSYVAQNS